MSDNLKLVAVKTNDGKYYIAIEEKLQGKYTHRSLDGYLINGVKPGKTFSKDWYLTDEPKRISKKVYGENVNYRYELMDESFSDKLPATIKREDVAEYNDDTYEWEWYNDMFKYKSLYELKYDKQDDTEEDIPFSLEILFEVDNITEPDKMSYNIQKTRYKSDGLTQITEESISHPLIDRVIYPEILLTKRPCKLSSQQTYEIIRQYVKENIDLKVATITSDYDFCFTVKKRIKLAKVKKFTVDVNNNIFQKRKRKPKYVERQETERLEEVFEMTHKKEGYQHYTVIEGFFAENQHELKKKIDRYLKELIEHINHPIKECDKCEGGGVL